MRVALRFVRLHPAQGFRIDDWYGQWRWFHPRLDNLQDAPSGDPFDERIHVFWMIELRIESSETSLKPSSVVENAECRSDLKRAGVAAKAGTEGFDGFDRQDAKLRHGIRQRCRRSAIERSSELWLLQPPAKGLLVYACRVGSILDSCQSEKGADCCVPPPVEFFAVTGHLRAPE